MSRLIILLTILTIGVSCGKKHKESDTVNVQPFVGSWTMGINTIRFDTDGHGYESDCNSAFHWSIDPDSGEIIILTDIQGYSKTYDWCFLYPADWCNYEIVESVIQLSCYHLRKAYKK